ncbi:hypothetical protein [Saccharopolyspora shandongensis]|uniref:hypothetical protein n=1 Tax=Saccharopolyspora shandongensis TaxID=418495 RepID=UPI0033D25D76
MTQLPHERSLRVRCVPIGTGARPWNQPDRCLGRLATGSSHEHGPAIAFKAEHLRREPN